MSHFNGALRLLAMNPLNTLVKALLTHADLHRRANSLEEVLLGLMRKIRPLTTNGELHLAHLAYPDPDFLGAVRSLCDAHGAVMVFDETVTGLLVLIVCTLMISQTDYGRVDRPNVVEAFEIEGDAASIERHIHSSCLLFSDLDMAVLDSSFSQRVQCASA